MPFSSVSDLKSSELFKRMPTLQSMSTAKLRKFVETFNSVHARALRNGAGGDEAEISAIRIALAAAKKAEAVAARPIEDTVHVFALMTKDMFSVNDGVDTGLVFPDVETMNDVMAGNPFNLNHDHSDQMGVIREVVATKDLPPDVRSKVDPDVRVVVKASFFSDVPQEDRHDTVSAEWFQPELQNGLQLAIPHTFAITSAAPANGRELGIGRVASNPASTGAEQPYKGGRALPPSMGDEPDKQADLESKVASLSTAFEAEKAKTATLEEKLAAFDEVKQRLAALAGEKTDPEELDAKTVIASLDSKLKQSDSKVASLEKQVEELVQAGREAQAEAFAEEVWRTKQIGLDRRDFWASFYLKDPEQAKAALADLGDRDIPAGESKAHLAAPETDNPEEVEFLASAFGPDPRKKEAS